MALVLVGCASEPELEGLARDPLGKNQYFDRVGEFLNFGRHEDYYFLLGYNFSDATELLISTSRFHFGTVKSNYKKERRFVLINPFEKPVKGVRYQIKGHRFFSISQTTCKAELKPREVCVLHLRFHPVTKGSKYNLTGLHKAQLVITYPKAKPIVKALQGQSQ